MENWANGFVFCWFLKVELGSFVGVSTEVVQKIDKSFLEHGTREEFREAILGLLEAFQGLAQENVGFKRRVLALENELRTLHGEKKSPTSGRLIDRR